MTKKQLASWLGRQEEEERKAYQYTMETLIEFGVPVPNYFTF